MRTYDAMNIGYAEGQSRGFFATNLNAISASIKSIISQVRVNGTSIDDLTKRIEEIEKELEEQKVINADFEARITALEP
ncbi:hypothetical protein QUF61_17495 [Candidatus Venteria ishoeyi]|uniref:hypothetical protein n=1 Tax=Candidatus Venteria ishoeyi TaxID=1899563 RepID=UPI0025A6680E|nr:hypothetical protein [Candidatus Venteria ishoeyi]MDM8548289.1 hypothetical protein [Candidatus Venteria ishoeyi]